MPIRTTPQGWAANAATAPNPSRTPSMSTTEPIAVTSSVNTCTARGRSSQISTRRTGTRPGAPVPGDSPPAPPGCTGIRWSARIGGNAAAPTAPVPSGRGPTVAVPDRAGRFPGDEHDRLVRSPEPDRAGDSLLGVTDTLLPVIRLGKASRGDLAGGCPRCHADLDPTAPDV